MSDFLSSNPEKKKAFVKSLGDAFDRIGFVIVEGHYLASDISDELYSQIKAFFPYHKVPKEIMRSMGWQDGGDIPLLEKRVPKG